MCRDGSMQTYTKLKQRSRRLTPVEEKCVMSGQEAEVFDNENL